MLEKWVFIAFLIGMSAAFYDYFTRPSLTETQKRFREQIKDMKDNGGPFLCRRRPLSKIISSREAISTALTVVFSCVVVVFIFAVATPGLPLSPKTARVPPAQEEPSSEKAPPAFIPKRYSRPEMAPSGYLWPTIPAYVQGFPQYRMDGLSTVTVDNRSNPFDVFVKLFSLDTGKDQAVRVFFIPKWKEFSLQDVSPGKYDVRYQNLSSGQIFRSEPFFLSEVNTRGGVQYQQFSMTLYGVPGGNSKRYSASIAEF